MRIEIDDEALAEAVEAKDYYAALSPELGDDFARTVDLAIERIVANPLAWPPYTARTRRYLVDRFPYAIVYRAGTGVIRILAVMHQHRRPGYWTRRLR
jgi:plasmid stabilization system protein ParE